jgi:putative flavoprotein involved in K+ transport
MTTTTATSTRTPRIDLGDAELNHTQTGLRGVAMNHNQTVLRGERLNHNQTVLHRPSMVDCVVVGAGPAGLAASAALTARGVDHLVLERGRIGQSWRAQRWNSLRLNNPGWMNPMLGDQPPASYLPAAEVVERLRLLAAPVPVREHVPVCGLTPDGTGWVLRTGDGPVRARTVVVASGGENVPHTPRQSRLLPGRIAQIHAANYRRPGLLPGGAVLVVGSAQSGYQITEELLAAGRRVVLATNQVGRAPARHRGRDTVEWLVECGFFDQRLQDLPDPSIVHAPQPLVAPGGRSASLQTLARAGATLTGRLVAVEGDRLCFDDSTEANITAADAFAARIRAMLDAHIRRTGRLAPPAEPDDADLPVDLDPPTSLDLRAAGIGSVIWCTGYTADFSWLDPALLDDAGRPVRHGAAAALPGVWFIGLRWLTRRSSGNFLGFPVDAAAVADAVAATLGARPLGAATAQPTLELARPPMAGRTTGNPHRGGRDGHQREQAHPSSRRPSPPISAARHWDQQQPDRAAWREAQPQPDRAARRHDEPQPDRAAVI